MFLTVPTLIHTLHQNTLRVTGAFKGASLSVCVCVPACVRACVYDPCRDSHFCHWDSFKKACIQAAPLILSCWEIINIFSLSPAHYGQNMLITGWIYGALRPHSPCFGRTSAGTGRRWQQGGGGQRLERRMKMKRGGWRRWREEEGGKENNRGGDEVERSRRAKVRRATKG